MPLPEQWATPEDFATLFQYFWHRDFPIDQEALDLEKQVKEEGGQIGGLVESSETSSERPSEKTSERVVLMMKADKNVTIAVIAKALNKSTRAIEMQIKNLKEAGRIERIGSDSTGYWEICGS